MTLAVLVAVEQAAPRNFCHLADNEVIKAVEKRTGPTWTRGHQPKRQNLAELAGFLGGFCQIGRQPRIRLSRKINGLDVLNEIATPENWRKPWAFPSRARARGRKNPHGEEPRSASAGPPCVSCCGAISGFAREALMAWCENNAIDYLFGLARNTRLVAEIEAELATAAELSQKSGTPARRFKDFTWTTRDSWSRERRVGCQGRMDRWRGQSPVRCHLSLTRGARGPASLREALLRPRRHGKPH